METDEANSVGPHCLEYWLEFTAWAKIQLTPSLSGGKHSGEKTREG